MLGKAAGFFSALSSFPLSTVNPILPFIISTLLAAFSWGINVIYLLMGGWLARGAGVGLEDWERERERKVGLKKMEGNRGGSIALPAEEDDQVDAERAVPRPHSPSSTLSTLSSDIDVPGGHQALHDPRDTQPLMLSAREAEEVVARKKRVILHEIVKLGDVFWLYLAFNCESFFLHGMDMNVDDVDGCSPVRGNMEPVHAYCCQPVFGSVWVYGG